ELTAEIADLIALTGIRTAIDGDLTSLAALSELAETELPETDSWNIRVRADSDNPRGAPVNISANLSGTGITAEVDAVVEDLRTPDTFETELAFKAETIATVGKLLGRDLPEGKPLTLTAHASGQPGGYRVDTFLIESGESSMTADLEYLIPAAKDVERNTLKGLVAIRGFDSTPWLSVQQDAEPVEEEAVASVPAGTKPVMAESPAQEATEKKTGKKIFSDEPFAFDLLREYDVDLKFETEDILVPSGVELDSEIGIRLDNGLLEVSPFVIAESSGGSGYGHVTLDARSIEARLDAEIDFDNFTSPRFGGFFDLNIDLEGTGKSPASLMGNLNGYLTASIDDMELEKSFLTTFGSGLVSRLNPLGKDTTMLECAVVRFDIEDGVADFEKKLAAQTTEVTWIGGGKIDFKTEEIEGGISSKPREALSSLTNVVDVAGFVLVDGTLAEPTFGIDVANVVTDAAKKYAQYTAFFMTGGLSWLAEKAVETAQANVDQCERILGDLEDL
ncbi:MAG TPA: AsmA family protein, partial [Desulfopila sp.]|nr:AsmA family protein [Desulfopila sp.]